MPVRGFVLSQLGKDGFGLQRHSKAGEALCSHSLAVAPIAFDDVLSDLGSHARDASGHLISVDFERLRVSPFRHHHKFCLYLA